MRMLKPLRFRKDKCLRCGYENVIVLHKGQSEFHGMKCPVCKSLLQRKAYVSKGGVLTIGDEVIDAF